MATTTTGEHPRAELRDTQRTPRWGDGRWGDVLFASLLLLPIVLLAALTVLSDRAYLPRHVAARDLPWCAATADPTVQREPDNRSFNDKIWMFHPDHVYAAKAYRTARVPLWNPLILGGVPHAANPLTGVFYPPRWVAALAPDGDAPLVFAALHLGLAGLCMMWFLRAACLGRVAALFGGFAFAFSGWMAAHLQNTPIAATATWIPLGLCGLELYFHGRRRGLAVLAVAVAMLPLAGFLQASVLGGLVLGLYAVFGLLARPSHPSCSQQTWRRASALALATVLGVALAVVQLIPTLELLGTAARGGRTTADLANEHYRAPALLGIALPRLLGDPRQAGDWRDGQAARAILGEGPERRPPPIANWSERTVYPGVLVLLLAIVGAAQLRRRVPASLVCLVVLGFVMAMSETAIGWYGRVPGFDVGAPARAVLLPVVCLPALAAFGLQRVAGLLAGPVAPRLRWVARLLMLLSATAGLASAGSAIWWEPAGLRTDLAIAAVVLGLSALGFELARRGHVSVRALGAAAITIALVELAAFFVPVNMPVRSEGLHTTTPALRFLRENLGHERILRVSADPVEAVADRPVLFHPNQGLLFGIRDAQGYRELVPRESLEVWRGLAGLWSPVGFSGIPVQHADSGIVRAAAVRYLVAARPIAALAERQVYPPPDGTTRDLFVYENPRHLPRARFVPRARVASDEDILARLRATGAELEDEVLVAALPSGATPAVPGAHRRSVEWIRDEPEHLELAVGPGEAGYLVLADTWNSGWQASCTDASARVTVAPVLRALSCYRAIPVGAGPQRVTLRYAAVSFEVGAWISLLAFGIWIATAVRGGRAAPPSREAGTSHGGGS